MKKLKILGVCAGGGTLLFPFKDHKILANIEPRKHFHCGADLQWQINFGKIPFIVKGLEPDWKPDVILGSPDCGASSIMRLSKSKVLGDPTNNNSINLMFDAIKLYKPRVFLIENLPRFLSVFKADFFENNFPDYELTTHTISVMAFGNSQKSRIRSVIIGVRKDQKLELKLAFRTIFAVRKPRKVKKLLYDYRDPDNYNIPRKKVLAMYDYRKLPKKDNLTVKEIHKLWNEDFRDENKWPIKTKKMHTLPGVYKLKENTYPLTVRPADRQFRPDGWPLGIKDYKAIMGLPEDFHIYMDKREYLTYLNKARYTICKGSVYEVGLWFKECLISGLTNVKITTASS